MNLRQLLWPRASTVTWIVLLLGTIASIAWYATMHLTLAEALFGYSPVGMIHPTSALPGFAANYPNGEDEMSKSLVANVLEQLGHTGLPDRVIAMLIVALEALVLMVGTARLARAANDDLPTWAVLAGALLMAAGTIASADFARWFHPFYGSVYNFAFGLGLAALAAALERRLWIAGLLLGIAIAVHPIIAMFFGIAAGLAVLADIRAYRLRDMALSAAIVAVLAAGWYLHAYDQAGIVTQQADSTLFVQLTTLMSYHWHPLNLEILGNRAWEVALPQIALIGAVVLVVFRPWRELPVRDRQLVAAMSGLFLLSLVGLYLSATSENMLLIKLALHRASLVVLLIGVTLIVPRLAAAVTTAPLPIAIVAAALLLMPFWRPHGLPVLGVALLAGVILITPRRSLFGNRKGALLALLSIALVCGALVLGGYGSAIEFDMAATVNGVTSDWFYLAAAAMLVACLARTPLAVGFALAVAVLTWVPGLDSMRSPDLRSRAQAFLETQQWANANTEVGSLFMIDPMIAYGWRQYSGRPSFGTLREWLYSGWIYNTDPRTMAEGIRRAELLGVNRDDFILSDGRSADDARAAISAKADAAFNGMSADELRSLAQQNDISFFVFDRSKRSDFEELAVVFQNDQFAVVTAF